MKRLAVLFTFLILTIIILADLGRLPRALRVVYDFPYGDKLGHLVLFGMLNFLVTSSFIASRPGHSPKVIALSAGLILAALIAIEEYSQKYFAKRTFDLIDLFAGCLGLFLGGWAALSANKRRPF
jgi:VanZ family protein